MEYDNNNRGVLFRVTDKKSEKHPDFTGKCEVNGKEMSLAGWTTNSKDGKHKFLSLKFSDPSDYVAKGEVEVNDSTNTSDIPF